MDWSVLIRASLYFCSKSLASVLICAFFAATDMSSECSDDAQCSSTSSTRSAKSVRHSSTALVNAAMLFAIFSSCLSVGFGPKRLVSAGATDAEEDPAGSGADALRLAGFLRLVVVDIMGCTKKESDLFVRTNGRYPSKCPTLRNTTQMLYCEKRIVRWVGGGNGVRILHRNPPLHQSWNLVRLPMRSVCGCVSNWSQFAHCLIREFRVSQWMDFKVWWPVPTKT